MSTAVESQCSLKSDDLIGVLFSHSFIELFFCCVVVGNICVVMFATMMIKESVNSRTVVGSATHE